MDEIIADAITYVEESPYCLLITAGSGEGGASRPFARYVGPVANVGLDLYFATRIASGKVAQMEEHPLVICWFQRADQTPEKFRSVGVEGVATRLAAEADFNRALDLLGGKSQQYKKYIGKEGRASWAIYKVAATCVHYTDFSKSQRTIQHEIRGECA
jgi:nitroimidazol reductase NimA-like FMN-containing flavoprotein (pyridoxamine 5'-phosphate oxidase superfamily)